MGDFFNSDIVKKTMTELSDMQQELLHQVLFVPYMSSEQKKEHLQLMRDFLEKQKILFFRMSLSDDPEAIEIKNQIIENAKMFGVLEGSSTEEFFSILEKTIEGLAKLLDT